MKKLTLVSVFLIIIVFLFESGYVKICGDELFTYSAQEVLNISEGILSNQEANFPRSREGTDTWIFCHGMEVDMFTATCSCMIKLKTELARIVGGEPKTMTQWPVIEDRIYTLQDCMESLKLLKRHNQTHSRQKRKFYRLNRQRWSFPVKYQFHHDVTDDDKFMIREAMKHWEGMTCARFVEWDPRVHSHYTQRLQFTNRPNGCYSFIGKQTVTTAFPQQINLESAGCTAWVGVPVHEIGHALGLFHEQNRLDRDNWVNFHDDHIFKKQATNFIKERGSASYGVPYDYGSVMQYDSWAFSNGFGIVLEAIYPYSEYTMGQRGHLSSLDAEVINKVYCNKVCDSRFALPCQHGGYMDPNNCQQCQCPEGLGGRICEAPADSHPECTPMVSILKANDTIQCLKSPGYDDRGYYQLDVKCNWIIQAPPGKHIRARFDGPFGIYCSANMERGPMCFHWVEIKFKKEKRIRGGRFCCYDKGTYRWNIPPHQRNVNDSMRGVVISEDNVMVVHFDGTWPLKAIKETILPSSEARRGFKLCFALTDDSTDGSKNDGKDGEIDPVNEWFSRPFSAAHSLHVHGSVIGGWFLLIAATICLHFEIRH